MRVRDLVAGLAAFDLGSLDAVEDRKVRGQLKSAVVRARRALEAGPGPGPEEPAPGAAAPAPAAEVTPAGAASAAPAAEGSVPDAEGSGASDGAAERAALIEALTAAGVTIPEVPESLTLAALDEIMDRRLRGQAKAALRKLQRALGMVD